MIYTFNIVSIFSFNRIVFNMCLRDQFTIPLLNRDLFRISFASLNTSQTGCVYYPTLLVTAIWSFRVCLSEPLIVTSLIILTTVLRVTLIVGLSSIFFRISIIISRIHFTLVYFIIKIIFVIKTYIDASFFSQLLIANSRAFIHFFSAIFIFLFLILVEYQ